MSQQNKSDDLARKLETEEIFDRMENALMPFARLSTLLAGQGLRQLNGKDFPNIGDLQTAERALRELELFRRR